MTKTSGFFSVTPAKAGVQKQKTEFLSDLLRLIGTTISDVPCIEHPFSNFIQEEFDSQKSDRNIPFPLKIFNKITKSRNPRILYPSRQERYRSASRGMDFRVLHSFGWQTWPGKRSGPVAQRTNSDRPGPESWDRTCLPSMRFSH